MGIKVSLPCITKNRITTLSLSAQKEVVRELNSYDTNHHVYILHEQLEIMFAKATNARTPNSNSKLYSPEVLVRAFGYYAKSRSLYLQLREDFKLPSVRTLQKVTSKC